MENSETNGTQTANPAEASPQTFKQPTLETAPAVESAEPVAETLPEATLVPYIETGKPVDNTGKTDELSQAVAASLASTPVIMPGPREPAPGKYKLSYLLHGQRMNESHVSVRKAVARVADLRRLGIVAETSTAE